MLSILKHRVYARLFTAQVIALLGTGLLTVALGLLAYDLAGAQAGVVLGFAYTIKMVAYVGLSPIAHALVERMPRKVVLIGADLIRAFVALFLPLVDSVWQIYLLIFVLQAASATFTPAFQALIPDILKDERDYTKALSLSRLAYDLENLLSPAMAGVLMMLVSYHWLFAGTVAGFAVSAALVAITAIPTRKSQGEQRPFVERLTRGTRIYLATPRLRGLLALNLSAAAVGAFILVNTVVIVRSGFGASEIYLAYAMAAFGAGSMLTAVALPRLLETVSDRAVMIRAAFLLTAVTLAHAGYLMVMGQTGWTIFLTLWAISGVLYSAILTPSGRLLRRSAHAKDRPAIFAAQFALSHACWLVTYPIAGWAGDQFGLPITMMILGALAFFGVLISLLVWPASSAGELEHQHPDLPADHPHFKKYHGKGKSHSHVIVIDDEHRAWPTHG